MCVRYVLLRLYGYALLALGGGSAAVQTAGFAGLLALKTKSSLTVENLELAGEEPAEQKGEMAGR